MAVAFGFVVLLFMGVFGQVFHFVGRIADKGRRPDQTGVHGVYRVDPDGTIARILTEPEVVRPNGIVISPDDRTLYMIETEQSEGGPRMIRAYDLSDAGTVSNMRVFHDFSPGRSGDGMTIDSEGNLYVGSIAGDWIAKCRID